MFVIVALLSSRVKFGLGFLISFLIFRAFSGDLVEYVIKIIFPESFYVGGQIGIVVMLGATAFLVGSYAYWKYLTTGISSSHRFDEVSEIVIDHPEYIFASAFFGGILTNLIVEMLRLLLP